MAKFAISQEGASAMNALANGLLSHANCIIEASQELAQRMSIVNDDIGVYADEINDIVSKNMSTLLERKEDIEALSTMLYEKSEQILELSQLMLNDSSEVDIAGSFPQVTQCQQLLQSQLDEIETVKSPNNNSYFVPGANYEKYSQLSNTFDSEYTTESFVTNGTDYVTNINPHLIEGINMSEAEAQDMHLFWNRNMTHEIESEEYFTNVASQIPAVRNLLDSGKAPEDIKLSDDQNLADCYNLFFANPVNVTDCGGFYEFGGSGRHRTLAARLLGYDIPVRVTGRYVRK